MDGVLDAFSHDWLVAFLLLFVREQNSYGGELMERMTDVGSGATRPGETYRTLQLMEEEGLIFSEREGTVFLLSQRRYGLTGTGEACLEFLAHPLEGYRKEIKRFLRIDEGRPVPEVRA